MRKHLSLIVVLLCFLHLGCVSTRGTAPTEPETETASDAPKSFDEVITDTTRSDAGLLGVHFVDHQLYLELADSLFGRDMLLVSRVAGVPHDFHPYLAAGTKLREQVLRWERRDDRVLLRGVSYRSVASDSLPVYRSVVDNNFQPVLAAFDVAATGRDSASVIVEASSLFETDVRALGLSDTFREEYEVRSLDVDRSYVASAKSFPLNLEVRHVLTYIAGAPPSFSETGTLSVQMSQSMVLLPADRMARRLHDERVGWFTIEQIDFGLDEQKAAERKYIRRWRLEPSDPAAYARGELVPPVRPIVYYLDPATPVRWRPYIRQGIEDWNVAFETAGFRDAVMAMDAPTLEEDPDWSPEDIRYSTVRWVANLTRNAMGPSVTDPRTGEIIESDIIWYHNHLRSYRNRLLIETGAQNRAVRSLEIPEAIIGETMRQVIAHEVGHALGLPHNMAASSAYPVDSLRSGTFTRRMGIAPTIMDYARQNYIAQPGDDVRYIRQIGPYDHYAINWGYRLIPGADKPEEEESALDAWILERAGDPVYRFGTSRSDPRTQTEDLGDDNVRASRYGIANLQRVVPRLIEWTTDDGGSYEDLNEIYGELVTQWTRYVRHVAANVGGVYETLKTADQEGPVFEVVSEARQREAIAFLGEEVFETPTWLLDPEILRRIEDAGAIQRMRNLQVGLLDGVLSVDRMQRLIEAETFLGEETYTLLEMLDDLRTSVWAELASGEAVDAYRRNLQRGHVDRLTVLVGEGADGEAANRTDIGAFARGELDRLREEVRVGLEGTDDAATRYHLLDVAARIDRILDPPR